MSVTLTVRDETTAGQAYHEISLEFPSEHITIRDLIRERVYQEVQDFNRRQQDVVFRGLVQPINAERILNGNRTEYRLPKECQVDWKLQFEKAIEAFESNGFFLLIDDQQATSLDQKFEISSSAQVSFVKLTLLVGG